MKKIIKFALVATMLALVVAVSAMAHTVTYNLVEYDASVNEYDLVITVACDNNEKTTTFATKLELNTEVVGPLSTEAGYITAGKITVTEGRNDNTYSFSLLDQAWTTEGTTAKLLVSCTSADFAKFNSTVDILTIPLKIVEGKTPADILENDLKVTYVVLGTSEAEYAYNEPTITNPIGSIVNNAVIKNTLTLTIPVTAGDVIYEGNKAPVVAAETGDYTLSITEGVVVVNTGFTAQKFYNVEDGAVTEDTSLANGVLSTNRASIRDDEKYSGIRYMSTFLTALKSKVAEYGYLVTAENTFTGLKDTEYELNMALHNSGLANKAVAYNGEKDIYWNVEGANTVVTAVVTNVPETEEAVQTYIATRPYYILKDGTVVYGETMRKTVYEVAYSIKKNDSATYQLYKDYIDRLLALVKLNKEPTIDLSPLFPAV